MLIFADKQAQYTDVFSIKPLYVVSWLSMRLQAFLQNLSNTYLMKKLTIIYDRASKQTQAGNWSRKDAKQEGRRPTKKYGFDKVDLRIKVKSGEELLNRPVMMRILEEIEAGKVGAIIVQNFSRLSRDKDNIDGKRTKKICRDNNCFVITPEMAYDFNLETHDAMADLQFFGAKIHKRNLVKFVRQGMRGKANEGGFMRGIPMLGYDIIYEQSKQPNEKPKGDLAVNQNEAEIVRLIFKIYPELGANSTAKHLNELGHRKPRKGKKWAKKYGNVEREFNGGDIRRIIASPLYPGFAAWGVNKQSEYLKDYEPKFIFREDLQIISLEVWEHCQKVMNDRSVKNHKTKAKWSKYAFSGIIGCPNCGVHMQGKKFHRKRKTTGKVVTYVSYRCYHNQQIEYRHRCERGATISQNLAASVIIPFTAEVINKQIGLSDALENAADKFGKTSVELALEASLKAVMFGLSAQIL